MGGLTTRQMHIMWLGKFTQACPKRLATKSRVSR